MKNLAKRNLICFAVLAVILIALCFINIGVPATTSRFVGFVPAITKDIDISGGVASKYEVTYADGVLNTQQELERTVKMLSSKLSKYGYGNACVSTGSNDNIYVEIPKVRQSSAILDAIATTGALYITTDSLDSINEETAINGEDVMNVTSKFSQTSANGFSWGVNVHLTDEGKNKLADLTENAASSKVTLNIFVGENTISQIGISGQYVSNDLYFYGTSSTEDSANVTSLQILMGKYNAEFDMVNNEIIEIAPLISNSIQTLIIIAITVISALLLVMFFVMFGQLGFIVTLNYAFLLTLSAFFMQALPIFVLSYSGVVGLGLGIILFFMSNFIIFNSAKKSYAEGKKIPLSIKLGIKNNALKIVDISVIAIIASIVLYFVGGVYVQSFALGLAILSALNLLTSLALNMLFTKWYIRINSKDAKKLHFIREDNISELD